MLWSFGHQVYSLVSSRAKYATQHVSLYLSRHHVTSDDSVVLLDLCGRTEAYIWIATPSNPPDVYFAAY